jgi:alcohol dehydrogenase class IV
LHRLRPAVHLCRGRIEFELTEEMVDQVMGFSTTRANPRLASREEMFDLFSSIA